MAMEHLSEEQIVLHYYGDAEQEEEVGRHLSECSDCRAEFGRVKALLEQIGHCATADRRTVEAIQAN